MNALTIVGVHHLSASARTPRRARRRPERGQRQHTIVTAQSVTSLSAGRPCASYTCTSTFADPAGRNFFAVRPDADREAASTRLRSRASRTRCGRRACRDRWCRLRRRPAWSALMSTTERTGLGMSAAVMGTATVCCVDVSAKVECESDALTLDGQPARSRAPMATDHQTAPFRRACTSRARARDRSDCDRSGPRGVSGADCVEREPGQRLERAVLRGSRAPGTTRRSAVVWRGGNRVAVVVTVKRPRSISFRSESQV